MPFRTTVNRESESERQSADGVGQVPIAVQSGPAVERIPSLQADWARLSALSSPGLFQSHDWMRLWLSHFGDERSVELCTVATDGAIRLVAPLCFRTHAVGPFQIRLAETIGTLHLPSNDFVYDPGRLRSSFEALVRFLVEERRVHILRFRALPEESSLTPLLRSRTPWRHGDVTENVGCRNRYAVIDEGFPKYHAERSPKLRLEVRADLRRLIRMGALAISLHERLDEEPGALNAYFDLYARSWQGHEGREDFLRNALKHLATLGKLRLFFLRLEGRPIAAQLLAIHGDVAYNLKNFYDRDFRRCSPGTVLTSDAFQRTIQKDRVRTIDYMKGDSEHKARWAPEVRRRLDWIIPIGPLGGIVVRLRRLQRRGPTDASPVLAARPAR